MAEFTYGTEKYGMEATYRKIMEMRKVVSENIFKNGGRVYKVFADNLFAMFNEPSAAFAATEAIVRELPDSIGICVGIGHGPVQYYPGENDYYGTEVNLASKLGEDIAGSSEVLFTRNACSRLPESVKSRIDSIRSFNIKDLTFEYYSIDLSIAGNK